MLLLTHPNPIPNEHVWIHLFFEKGLKTLHVRKPDFSKEELIEYIEKIDKKYHKNLMLHNHIELIEQFDLKGISFTGKTKNQHEKFKDLAITKSWATHSVDELKNVPDDIDYVFLSPLYPSISKLGYDRAWEISDFEAFVKNRNEKKFKIVALGGINQFNYQYALNLGFDEVAVLGCLWEAVIQGKSKREILGIFNQF